ncbi:TPA: hypothetical protein H1011_01150 [archaeon]|jgi:hypothetical protein|uniref:Uncharacterized protein n=1 Tax=Candidatus Undinarchaeum marinum TaxID=2756141 RepID=A0A832V3R6_9ARCH|nr:hypothetical protein [Candidatus Undinarchaeum marinum]
MIAETKKDGRGRPVGSPIREKIKQILGALGCAYGYKIHKIYLLAFEPLEARQIYYHLKKGVQQDEFKEYGIEKIQGNYTWGSTSTRKYYSLDPTVVVEIPDSVFSAMRVLGLKYKETPEDSNKVVIKESDSSEKVSVDKDGGKNKVDDSDVSRPHKTYG